ncbi:MAG TPA: PilZ domain-containing protein [Candidatus Acidoferrales bacterium]|nr:PilZ domain-containing protein [Candidatus Acidoferrales bacterium]
MTASRSQAANTAFSVANRRGKGVDARRRKRIRLSLPVHIRPFESRLIDIEDIGEVIDFTHDGLLFVTCMPHYRVGMRLIVTFPFGQMAAAQRKFLATVVRLDERSGGNSGVAVRFLL